MSKLTMPSLRNYINLSELLKALASGLASGTLVGVLQALLVGVGTIFTAPWASVAAGVLALLVVLAKKFTEGAPLVKLEDGRDAELEAQLLAQISRVDQLEGILRDLQKPRLYEPGAE